MYLHYLGRNVQKTVGLLTVHSHSSHLVQNGERSIRALSTASNGDVQSYQQKIFGKVGVQSSNDIVVVSALRTPITKANRGQFKNTTPDDLLKAVLESTLKGTGIKPTDVDDITVGNAQLQGSYSWPAREAMFRAGFTETTSIKSVNRQCSSGLQAIADVANNIATGVIDIGIGSGVESMTHGGAVSDTSKLPINLKAVMEHPLARDSLMPMGITSETVAKRYGITREAQDAFAVESHAKALKAQAKGNFDKEIIPVTVTVEDAEGKKKSITVTKDESPREGTTMEVLAKLKLAFDKNGTTTAGNASPVNDGAAAALLMRRSEAQKRGLPILGVFRGYKVKGVLPDEMGVGPAVAIPALLQDVQIGINDVDVYEINEAFASQAIYCVKKLGIKEEKVNPNGGAIALGHPLGATGARQVATLLNELQRRKAAQKDNKPLTGVVSMCIGTGMGAAGVFEV